MRNTFGHLFTVTSFGESHGAGVGAVVDGCPARLPLSEADLQPQLDRRRPGQSDLTTPRNERDTVRILSGTEGGMTMGSPIALLIANADCRTEDYGELTRAPRPSHADYAYKTKYGILAAGGGGRASARETAGRVAAGAVAEKLLQMRHGIEIVAWVSAVGEIEAAAPDLTELSRTDVDATPVRCPDLTAATAMATAIRAVRDDGDSIGGVVSCVCRGVPVGFGEPVFGKLSALLAGAMLSIPAARGFDLGSGFAGTRTRGSINNDAFEMRAGRLRTRTNHSGGIQAGISNGEALLFRVAFKPVSTIARPQASADWDGRATTVQFKGRHDPCVLPRAVPVVEAMAALVLADAALMAAAGR